MDPIVIENEESWPLRVQTFVRGLKDRYVCYEDVGAYDRELLSKMCSSYDYVVYHYTREGEHFKFLESGLRCLSLDAHVQEFLEIYDSRFTGDEIIRLKDALYGMENRQHQPEGRIYFTVPQRITAKDLGIRDLVGYFGGEAIYWMFKERVGMLPIDRSISKKLRCIGKGCEVTFVAPAKWIKHGCFADAILEKAYGVDCGIDGSVNHDIPPALIRNVRYFEISDSCL